VYCLSGQPSGFWGAFVDLILYTACLCRPNFLERSALLKLLCCVLQDYGLEASCDQFKLRVELFRQSTYARLKQGGITGLGKSKSLGGVRI